MRETLELMSPNRTGETDQLSVPTPEDLMIQIAKGDESAFELLYDRLSAQVFGLIRRVLRDEAQSEEVAQEVFVEAWQHAARYDATKGKAITWLLTMAHRRAVDRVRASQASKDRDLTQGIKEFQASYDDVEETAIQLDESRRVTRALERLSDTQRDAIRLAYFGGYTHLEVAELLKIPVGTAKTRIRDGMTRLRDLMGVA